MFCGHDLGQWLHGFYPVQAQAEGPKLSQDRVSSISYPESRATKTVLVVSTFVCFNTLSSICYIILSVLKDPDLFIMNISAIITACFPTISPFLLMSCDSRTSRLCFAGKRNTNSLILMRKM